MSEWVDYIQTLHFREIELSLDRVRTVYARLYPEGFKPKVIAIAGTNGKGSCAEIVSAIYNAAGYQVGKFTSPHLVDFSERYIINGQQVSEQALRAALEKIEQVRAEVAITFFEFGALLAIELFASARVDVAVMEVGLGGRLDAINILDADVSIITSVSKDHTAWLGNTVEKIAYEKVGIARSGKPCIVGIEQPANSILDHCNEIGASVSHIGRDFTYKYFESERTWSWNTKNTSIQALPLPFDQAGVQLSNASVCVQAVTLLGDCLPVANQQLRNGLATAKLLARCQVLSNNPLVILDVAHNQSSVERLHDFLSRQNYNGRLIAVCGMLEDKEIRQSLAVLLDLVSVWHVATIDHQRGASANYVRDQLNDAVRSRAQTKETEMESLEVHCHDNPVAAYKVVKAQLETDDCLVVFGSFFVAGDILQLV